MRKILLAAALFITVINGFVMTQNYSMVIKGGHVIDPKNKSDAIMDIAINDRKIAMVAKNIL